MKRKYCLAITDNHKNLEVTATLFRTCNICLTMRINAKELVLQFSLYELREQTEVLMEKFVTMKVVF